jgi:hypothetical protein
MWNLLTNFASTDLKAQAQLSYCTKEDWAREISVFAKILNCAKRKGSEGHAGESNCHMENT